MPESASVIIHEFLRRYPTAEYGYAHIVLSDYNVDDDSINWCLGQIREYAEPSGEIDATVEVLQALLAIPEDVRDEWADA